MDAGNFVPSGHLAYYGMFDFFRYVLCHYIGIDYTRQDEDFKGKDSHNKLIKKVITDVETRLKEQGEEREIDIIDYKERTKSIKRLRNIADYKGQDVLEKEWTDNHESTVNLINDIKPLYHIA